MKHTIFIVLAFSAFGQVFAMSIDQRSIDNRRNHGLTMEFREPCERLFQNFAIHCHSRKKSDETGFWDNHGWKFKLAAYGIGCVVLGWQAHNLHNQSPRSGKK